ncbi:ER membrane complex subunit 10 [Brachionus plicatilis]|uniref:ER membrane protein complex subunit 10 n=1 Tax=Brachionus plicatilis TaxID=10195 RepID=A0A3M7SHW9_BRAPC|nr:ER membrane complex subunit 10 [Brachionus plicatilis]
MELKYLKVVVFLIQLILVKSDSLLNDSDLYYIEQSIDDSEFREIGQVNLRLLKQNQNSAQLQSINEEDLLVEKSGNIFWSRVESQSLDGEVFQKLKSALGNDNSIYRLRLCRKYPVYECKASSFIYAKALGNAGFLLNLTLHTSINNELNSLSIKISQLGLKEKITSIPDHLTFFVSVQGIKQAQQPDTETHLEKIRLEKEQKEKGSQSENQSFFSKYWMYIVPFFVIMFLANIVNPEAAAAGGSE